MAGGWVGGRLHRDNHSNLWPPKRDLDFLVPINDIFRWFESKLGVEFGT
jgi:hypothetical protein